MEAKRPTSRSLQQPVSEPIACMMRHGARIMILDLPRSGWQAGEQEWSESSGRRIGDVSKSSDGSDQPGMQGLEVAPWL